MYGDSQKVNKLKRDLVMWEDEVHDRIQRSITLAFINHSVTRNGPWGRSRPWLSFCSGSHAEFGRDSRSTFRRNADLDPKIQECRLNPSFFQSDSAWCAGLEIVDNMHKGV